MSAFGILFRRDLTLAWREGGAIGTALGFYLIVVAILPLGLGPHPLHGAVRPPGLMMRLVQHPAQTLHAGPLRPGLDDLAALRLVDLEEAHHGEAVGMAGGGLRRHLIDVLHRERRADDGGGHAGLVHLPQEIIGGEGRRLAVMRPEAGLLPDVDLGIDDQHGPAP